MLAPPPAAQLCRNAQIRARAISATYERSRFLFIFVGRRLETEPLSVRCAIAVQILGTSPRMTAAEWCTISIKMLSLDGCNPSAGERVAGGIGFACVAGFFAL